MSRAECTARSLCYIYVFCFFIPKIILKIPDKNLGLLTSTTFINASPFCRIKLICFPVTARGNQYLMQEIPSIITHSASTATKKRGGQKQLMSSPAAKVIATIPLLNPHLRIVFASVLHNKQFPEKCYFSN